MQTATKPAAVLDPAITETPAAAPLVLVPPTVMTLGPMKLTEDQIELLKNTICEGASDDELKLFLYVCERTQLDPFTRQIYAVKRGSYNDRNEWIEKMVHQTAIDGLRVIAQRSGQYRGQTEPLFYDAGGNERAVWLDTKWPMACKVGVHRQGFSEPVWATARWEEYVAKKRGGAVTKMWTQFPTVMLAKCAEALALRKAFPQELSGLYAAEEMDHLDAEKEAREQSPVKTLVTVTKATAAAAAAAPSAKVMVNFGPHKNRSLDDPLVTTQYLIDTFRTPWLDGKRKAKAVERLGQAFVTAVYDELERRGLAGDPLLSPPTE